MSGRLVHGQLACRLGIWAALAFGLTPLVMAMARPPAKVTKNDYFKGKVVPLAGLVEKYGSRLDADADPYWLALVTDEGKIYSLIKDDGARMFFKDARLRNRPMRLTARLLPGSQLLQVVEVHSYHKDDLYEVFYWCDICSIKRYEKKNCDCCGGPMELREEPVKK
jgi:hypothetical protein